jgi:Sjoegren syndrome nuclear autoantigen 1
LLSFPSSARVSFCPSVVVGIEELRKKREEVHVQILAEEEEKLKVQNDLHILTERLARLSESLNSKIATRDEYDRTIAETEGAYMKVRDRERGGPRIDRRRVEWDESETRVEPQKVGKKKKCRPGNYEDRKTKKRK